MADTNTERGQERGVQQRSQGGGLSRRGGDISTPSLFRRSPDELFAMNPFTLMRRLTEDIDRMFSGSAQAGGRDMGVITPPVEVRERSGNLVVDVELPGLRDEDITVEVRSGALVIQAERERESEENRGGIRRSERFYGVFYREIPLPEGAKVDQVSAQFNNGVLQVTIPVAEEQRPRQIPIGASAGAGAGQRKPIGTQ